MSDARPNILILMPDQMRADCMICAGHPQVKTPPRPQEHTRPSSPCSRAGTEIFDALRCTCAGTSKKKR